MFGRIEGYAALFDVPDLSGDIIKKGAFSKSLKKLIPASNGALKMLYQHQSDRPIGRWVSCREDLKGLRVTGEILIDTPLGEDVWKLLQTNIIDGLSIGFSPKNIRPLKKGRELREVDLWEISLVTFPMMPQARIDRISQEENLSKRLKLAAHKF